MHAICSGNRKNGLEIGEILKLQQKKIEELTLYLIKQNKLIDIQGEKLLEQNKLTKLLLIQVKKDKKKK